MNRKDRAKRDSVFSWNDQSANIRMTTWETGRKLNIKMYEKKWKTLKSFVRGNKKTSLQDKSASLQDTSASSKYVRHLRYSLDMDTPDKANEKSTEEERQIARELALGKFKKIVTKVILLRKVFIHVLNYAVEKGGHEKITSDPRLRLKVDHHNLRSDKGEPLFDPESFKTDYQGYFPKWAKEITLKAPGDRTDTEIESLGKLLRQLKEVRRFTSEIQRYLCKVIRYDRFGRHRVIIRKGHVGRRFYIIYSGTVAFTLSEDDCEVFSKPTEYYNLGKGDAFGELALIRNIKRSATIICLQKAEFLYIEKEDFNEMGIVDILRKEMDIRVEFMREFDLFLTWPQHVLRKVAEESRSMEYRNGYVIDNNLLQSDMLHIVIKGRCEVLRLLDLTHSKKWLKLRHNQKKLCNSEFEGNASSPNSRQGAYSRLSAVSNVSGYSERRIPRTLSQPHPQRKPTIPHHVQPRLVRSAHCTITQKRETFGKQVKRTSYFSDSKTRERSYNIHDRRACSKMERGEVKVGVGVFLSVDVIEKGQSAGLSGVTRTDEDMLPSPTDKRRLSLVSNGCFIISIPVESVKKHADYHTMKKIQKRVKTYPSDDVLVNFYLEKTKWNAYKEVLIGRMIKDIEKRKCERKPGSMPQGTNPVKQEQAYSYGISRPGTRQTICAARPQSKTSQQKSLPEEGEQRLPSPSLCCRSPATLLRPIPQVSPYRHKPSETIYARGSRRNLVVVNGRIRGSAIQEEVEEELLNHCMEVY